MTMKIFKLILLISFFYFTGCELAEESSASLDDTSAEVSDEDEGARDEAPTKAGSSASKKPLAAEDRDDSETIGKEEGGEKAEFAIDAGETIGDAPGVVAPGMTPGEDDPVVDLPPVSSPVYSSSSSVILRSGVLTAAEWSDIRHWDFWKGLVTNRNQYYDWGLEFMVSGDQPPQGTGAQVSDKLDLMLVIDATGSMGDEMEYLKKELENVVERVEQQAGLNEIRLSLIFYRDDGDDYVTRNSGFTTDITKQKKMLMSQSANGGGDTPEAVHTALEETLKQSWSADGRKKLVFMVLDAPPHEGISYKNSIQQSVSSLQEKNIQVFPVASSGVDKTTEFFLRRLAIATMGSYIFLTDDSGVGGGHLEATVGDHTIEYLNDLLVRKIVEEVSGKQISPVDYKQRQ